MQNELHFLRSTVVDLWWSTVTLQRMFKVSSALRDADVSNKM